MNWSAGRDPVFRRDDYIESAGGGCDQSLLGKAVQSELRGSRRDAKLLLGVAGTEMIVPAGSESCQIVPGVETVF